MTFQVHRAERADQLVEGLAELLRVPLQDPFAQELVLVPAKGIERWLSQRLSHRLGHAAGREDGVCAGVVFRTPWSLISEVLGTREEDPWAPDALVWPLLRVIDEVVDHHWAEVLRSHLGYDLEGDEGELRQGRRYAVARRLAGLFASYADQRPALLDDWSHNRSLDGIGRELPADLAWQPHLWRALSDEVGAVSPVQRHRDVVQRLRDGSLELDLPPRLSLFGHTRMSHTDAELMAALGERRDVHLWLPHPSDALWRGLVHTSQVGSRRDDTSHAVIDNPLLAAMSRDVRELQGVLQRVGALDAGAVERPDKGDSLLATMQADIAAARAPARTHLGDDTVQVHACHGPARQVEVLREVLLGLLQDDPTLEPRDILVMCPDIEAYSPLLTATFGLGDAVQGDHPGQRLRVQLADRSPTQTNPLLDVVAKVLDLADGRVEATRVLDLLATEPVSRRFGFTEDDHEVIAQWVSRSGVRWGWDEQAREAFGLGEVVPNTWRFGLDRLLTGVALSDDSRTYLDRALPVDDVSSTSISLVGRLVEALSRLESMTESLSGVHPVEHWLEAIRDSLAGIAQVAHGEEWQFAQVQRELAKFTEAAGEHDVSMRLGDVRALLQRHLGGRPGRANFRTGTLTICTMTPMRSVPHRVVCLLGLDDQVFPRGQAIDGDDVLGRDPLVGEYDARSADRQLFLDAIMSAGERLVITYTGFHESTGQPRPPSVPLREFIDAAYDTAPSAEGLVVQHHSQAFHPDYLASTKPFSFDPQAPVAARAALSERQPPPRLIDLRVPAPQETEILLDDLRDVLVNPVKAFLRQRLGIVAVREADELSDAIPISVGGLEEWQIGERLLRETLAGRGVDQIRAREWRRGSLPPGKLGVTTMRRIGESVGPLSAEYETTTQGLAAEHVDVDVLLPDGRRVIGTVAGVHDNRLVRVGYSRLKGKQRVETYLDLAAVAASRSGVWVARTIGRAEDAKTGASRADLGVATFNPIDDPMSALVDLVAMRDLLLSRPIPLLPNVSWVDVAHRGSTYEKNDELRKVWRQECRGPELALVFGHPPSLDEANALHDDDGQPLLRTLGRRMWLPIRRVTR